MSGPPRVRSMNVAIREAEKKPVKKSVLETEKKPMTLPSILKQQDNHHNQAVLKNMSMNASCSSDASSTDSSTHSGAKVVARRQRLRKKVEKVRIDNVDGTDSVDETDSNDSLQNKKRCAWVTPNTEPCYVAFHDEEWGVPVHDDKKLFELLCFSGALAELAWPTILGKRQLFREVFLDFDPCAVSRMNERKVTAPGSPANSLLSDLRLRSIIENARQLCKVMEEFGSFDTYIWNFVSHKPIVSQFRYPRQVPVKSPKAEFISKDLVKRGFRSVGPTVIYTFMQVAGLTNDHLISCFRFKECSTANAEAVAKEIEKASEEEPSEEGGLLLAVNKLSFTSK
ncbi:hypothetical protein Lal_00017570 [Lupinus albus]|uniref:Putative DNA-3-methyladenine glycosylase I n=1 Tax=Lupinus albus TaxID=3870 RepID=A0A6A5M5L4_LUPAL|nr:putative DNA-3-methyladenine glycosylase I [Lupinus albus]KAF1869991.1 hypothetical protein Lal_00017570 [Lupinus albus]